MAMNWFASSPPPPATVIGTNVNDSKQGRTMVRFAPTAKRAGARRSASVPRKTKVQKRNTTRSSRKPGKTTQRGRLSDVSASSISLQDAADFAGAAWKYGSYALGLLNAELKESYYVPVNGATGNFRDYLLHIAQGVDYNQRTGDSIRLENVRLDYSLTVNPAAAAGVTESRIIILRDYSNQGVLIAEANVLQDVSTLPLELHSPYLHSLGDRVEVLYDAVHAQTVNSDNAIIHKRIAFGIGDHVLWTGTTAAIGDTWQGHLFVIFVTLETVNTPKLTMSVLASYLDD
jgi:hypothetical protein